MSVVLVDGVIVALLVNAIPRFAFKVNEAVVPSVPPLKVNWPAVALPGAVPNPASALIFNKPALIFVNPVYVFVPPNVKVP